MQESADKEQEGDGLRIAWQYRRYINRKESDTEADGPRRLPAEPAPAGSSRSASSRPRAWATPLDLRKQMGEQPLQGCTHRVVSTHDASLEEQLRGPCHEFLQQIAEQGPPTASARAHLEAIPPVMPRAPMPPRRPGAVGRIAVVGLGASDADGAARVLMTLRGLVRERSAAALVTAPAVLFQARERARLEAAADAVLALSPLPSDAALLSAIADAPTAAALLQLRRLPLGASLLPIDTQDRPLYLVRHLRSRLSIKPIDIDPTFDPEAPKSSAAIDGLANLSF